MFWKLQSVSSAQAIPANVENRKIGLRVFCKFTNQIMNRGNMAMSTIINVPDIIFSSSAKVMFFSLIIASNLKLVVIRHPLPDFAVYHRAQCQ